MIFTDTVSYGWIWALRTLLLTWIKISAKIVRYRYPGNYGLFSSRYRPARSISLRGVSLDRLWTGHQPLYVFDLVLVLNIWNTSNFWAASYKNASNLSSYSAHGLYVHRLKFLPPNRFLKIRESQQFLFGLRLMRRLFEKINSKTGFYTNRDPNKD